MSQKFTTDLECPQCTHMQTTLLWKSLNVQVSPEALDDFRMGRINLFECEQCDFRGRVPIQFMYHDMSRRFAVLLIPYETSEEETTLRMFDPHGNLVYPKEVLGIVEQTGGSYIAQPHIVLSMEEMLVYVRFREALWTHHHGAA